jgi:pyruvate ferredoxin oxidoreductase alpha subunit
MLLTMGSFSQPAEVAIDTMRDAGKKVGLIKLRLWRPFPFKAVREALDGVKVLAVFDRCLSYGGTGGPVCSEMKAAFYGMEKSPYIVGFVGGLGGRDVLPRDFEQIIDKAISAAEKGEDRAYEMIGVRE